MHNEALEWFLEFLFLLSYQDGARWHRRDVRDAARAHANAEMLA